MPKRTVSFQLLAITMVAAYFLVSCNLPMAAAASAHNTDTPAATPTQAVPTATLTPAPTDTATPAPTGTATATATLGTAQVVPNVNAYCRKGPATQYDLVTTLTQGTPYNVLGQNLQSAGNYQNTWWQVQAEGSNVCWVGDSNVTHQGAVDQVQVVSFPPLPGKASNFTYSEVCNTTTKTLMVTLTWGAAMGATGYHIYRNGNLLVEVKAKVLTYLDNAPYATKLTYELEPFNDYGVGERDSFSLPACK